MLQLYKRSTHTQFSPVCILLYAIFLYSNKKSPNKNTKCCTHISTHEIHNNTIHLKIVHLLASHLKTCKSQPYRNVLILSKMMRESSATENELKIQRTEKFGGLFMLCVLYARDMKYHYPLRYIDSSINFE